MKQIYPLVALGVLLAGAVFFFSNFQLTTDGPGGPQLRPRDNPTAGVGGGFELPFGLGQQGAPSNPRPPANMPVSAPGQQALGGDMIRIASFNIQVFGESKMSKPEVVEVLANIVRNFDIVAVQEIRDEQQSLVPRFLAAVNAPGLRYDYVVGPRLGRTTSKEQYAYVYNTDTIEVDRRALYTVSDPDDLLHREPLVASFRCRRADPSLAFTFTLVTIHTDPTPQTLREELSVLDDVLLSVRNDPRGEDDVILLGDFNASYKQMTELSRLPGVAFALYSNLATNTAGNAQYDNLVFDRTATQEFLGRSGVFDFLRQYNLSQAQAKLVSDHLPVWAEFSVYEGGIPGRVARRSNYVPQPTTPYEPRYASPPDVAQPRYRQSYPAEHDYRNDNAPRPSRDPYFDPYAYPRDDRYSGSQPQYTADPRYPGSYDGGAYSPYPRDRR